MTDPDKGSERPALAEARAALAALLLCPDPEGVARLRARLDRIDRNQRIRQALLDAALTFADGIARLLPSPREKQSDGKGQRSGRRR